MPKLVQDIVQKHFADLSNRDLKVIADDERFQSDMKLFGDYCDQVDWENFYQKLKEYKAGERRSYISGRQYEQIVIDEVL